VVSREIRLLDLVEAGIALSSELSLEAVLARLLECGPRLTNASRAAVAILDDNDDSRARTLGDSELVRSSDRSGDRHRLVVPIVIRGAPYAQLVLSDKQGDDEFTAEDCEVVALLASQAATAIESARRYESATRWLQQLETLTEISNALAREVDLPRVLRLVTERLRDLIDARLVLIAFPTTDGDLEIRCADGEGARGLLGIRLSREGSKSGRVFDRRRSERVDVLMDDVEADQIVARRVSARAALFVPLMVEEEVIGMLMAVNKTGSRRRFSDDDLRLAEAFAARAAIAVDMSEGTARSRTPGQANSAVQLRGSLTKRETEVLRLVAIGLSDADVAERLVVSPRTVHAHLRSIYRKLGLSSRGAATRFAVEHKLV
jgi:GAF domain-containing protein